MPRLFGVLGLCMALAACAAPTAGTNAPKERVEAVAWRAPGPDTLTVITMINNRTGKGGHSALMINADQRVIFDPAGSFVNDRVPERDDVLFGVTPAVLAGYKSAHARSTFHVVTQTIEVTPQQAAAAMQLALRNGPVPRMFCADATTGLLSQVPGFGDIERTYYPTDLMEQMARRPGVREERYYEDDEGTIRDGIEGLVIED